ncbi:MAG TPA: ABC transporter ATP-binding protein [Solirubrobacterales bacterium]|nr:ABC transporter ATP-binding protein [Solirubrobacterales bacterium]
MQQAEVSLERPQPAPQPTGRTARRALLSAHGLCRAWGRRTVLDQVELAVEPGTLVGIGGANGAGKTTLLRICAGLIRPDRGSVELDGLDPHRDRARYQRRVGFLSAGDRGLYARLTVRQHLELWGRISLLDRRRFPLAIASVVESLDLGELTDQRMDRLSTGQRQRVRLAMAFLHEPDLVLLDEPLNSLDDAAAALMLALLARLTERGGAAIWCSPGLAEEAPFDRKLTLDAGRL